MEESSEPDATGGVYEVVGPDRGDRETAELLDAIRRGDADALERVAREHAPRLFRLAVRLTGQRADAEDLVQETLLFALPALKRFEGRAKLSTYLTRAMTNRWKNRLRARKRSRIVDWFRGRRSEAGPGGERELEPVPVDGSPSALDGLLTEQRAEQVRQAVTRIEPRRRLTLLLREVEELSYEEIARMTGVPVGTVRSRLARAREDLRMLLTRGEPD